jgi:hypothetical protein
MSDKDPADTRRRRLEGVIPDLLKRAVELGVEKATEAPDNLKEFVGGMKVPKEIAGYLLSQIDETKNGLFRVVAKEVRDFLEHTNFSGELQKMLTTVQFEINTTIRFKPNDGLAVPSEERTEEPGPSGASRNPSIAPLPKPEVKMDVHIKRDEPRRERRRSRE